MAVPIDLLQKLSIEFETLAYPLLAPPYFYIGLIKKLLAKRFKNYR